MPWGVDFVFLRRAPASSPRPSTLNLQYFSYPCTFSAHLKASQGLRQASFGPGAPQAPPRTLLPSLSGKSGCSNGGGDNGSPYMASAFGQGQDPYYYLQVRRGFALLNKQDHHSPDSSFSASFFFFIIRRAKAEGTRGAEEEPCSMRTGKS
jgi:hypothetical protein